ncbi:MAG: hypothetical protein HY400_02700 [Elusimicrobia bacterium]|nr:hypothetical protein [Elusimicrobiota bacterium]
MNRFESLGLLEILEVRPQSKQDAFYLEYLVRRLWFEVAPATPQHFSVDENWPIPAVVVRKGGTSFYIHGILHGSYPFPIVRAGLVRKMVRSLQKKNLPLFSEEMIPKSYAFSHGKETLDHRVLEGRPISLRDLSESKNSNSWLVFWRALKTAALGWNLFSAYSVIVDPFSPMNWIQISAAIPLSFLFWTDFVPVRKAAILLRAFKVWETEPDRNLADNVVHYLIGLAKQIYGFRLNIKDALRMELPMPLNEDTKQPYSPRVRSMASVIWEDAVANGLEQVHILCGFRHVSELAWYLSSMGTQRT